MTPEQQRIAIAGACGWRWEARMKGSIKVWNKPPNMVFHDEDLPDYLNDLNAMHEAEKVLTVLQQEKYCKILAQNFSKLYTPLASAGHRAEAFLRTLNLWKD